MKLLLALIAVACLAPDLAAALDRRVRVINESSYDVWSIQASNRDSGDWGPDLLGDSILPSGYNIIVDMNDYTGYCIMDMLAISLAGREWYARRNVCEISEWRLVD